MGSPRLSLSIDRHKSPNIDTYSTKMYLKLLLTLAFFACAGRAQYPKCEDFSAARCHREPVHMKDLDADGITDEQCQTICVSFTSCLFWRYDYNTTKCEMFNGGYRQVCEKYGGTKETTLDFCLSNPAQGDCDSYMHEECE